MRRLPETIKWINAMLNNFAGEDAFHITPSSTGSPKAIKEVIEGTNAIKGNVSLVAQLWGRFGKVKCFSLLLRIL